MFARPSGLSAFCASGLVLFVRHPVQRAINAHMLRLAGQHHQVIRMIIQPVAVNMMHNLPRQQGAANFLGCNNSIRWMSPACKPLESEAPLFAYAERAS